MPVPFNSLRSLTSECASRDDVVLQVSSGSRILTVDRLKLGRHTTSGMHGIQVGGNETNSSLFKTLMQRQQLISKQTGAGNIESHSTSTTTVRLSVPLSNIRRQLTQY